MATVFGEGDRPLDPTDDSRWSNYMSRNIEDDVVMYEFLKVFSLHRNVPEFLYCGEASYGIGPFKCNDYSAYPSVQRLAQVAAALELPMQYLAANGTLHFPAALGSTDFSPHPDHKAVSEVALRLIADGNASQGLMWYAPLLLDPCGVAPLIQALGASRAERCTGWMCRTSSWDTAGPTAPSRMRNSASRRSMRDSRRSHRHIQA